MSKKVLSILVVLMLLVSVSVASFASTPTGVRLTWSANPSTTQTINWTTDLATTTCKVQYKVSSSYSYHTVTAPAPTVYRNEVKLWKLTLYNLNPNTLYSYRVGDGTNWSAYYTFKTAPTSTNKFSFLMFGDSSNEDLEYEDWAETVNNAYTSNPNAKFMMNGGDTVEYGNQYSHWAPWLEGAQNVIAKIPVMLTLAKDDLANGDDDLTTPDLFPKMWTYPQNGVPGYIGQSYSFDYGNVHIAVANTQVEGYPIDFPAQQQMLDTIAAWLDADLSATNKQWKIVVWHMPFYPTMSDRAYTRQRNTLQPIIDKHQVDVVFDAHCHTIARTYPIRNNVMKSSPADGTVYYQLGVSNGSPKKDVSPKIWHAFSYDPQDTSNYLVVEVDDDELEIKCFKTDGTLIDEYEIDKGDPTDSTLTVAPPEYDKTHAVVFGTLVAWGERPDDEIVPGKWCVRIDSLAFLINGTFDPVTNILNYDDGELNLQIDPNEVIDGTWVTLEGLQNVLNTWGFDAYYNEDMNLIFIERWRE